VEVHESRNLIGAYRGAIARLRDGDGKMLETARDAARALRRMLTRLRLEHYTRLRRVE
jgi:hypothetical protein